MASNSNPLGPLSGHTNTPNFDLSSQKESMDSTPYVELINNIWGLARPLLAPICNLRGNVDSLWKQSKKLKDQREELEKMVKDEETKEGEPRTPKVAGWLGNVREFEGRVDQVLRKAEERDQIRCLSRCLPRNCWSSYLLGKTVDQMLNEARDLCKDGVFSILTLPSLPPPVLEMPMKEPVGLDTYLHEVLKWLASEKHGGRIGLYGSGGVGKTTLMKMINNNLLVENYGFEIVIWVEVSKMTHEEKAEDKIQNAIRERLGIKEEKWKGWTSDFKVHKLLEVFKEKKFLLLIDDVLGELDFSKVGVPLSPKNGSKVVFTTRLKDVCNQMGAMKTSLKVECLTEMNLAEELFEKSVGQSLAEYEKEVRDLAEIIIKECAGLPLALTIVGKAMAGMTKPAEWSQALSTLQKRPHDFPGMMEKVYPKLQFSYDRLDDHTLQSCFLYCCLFPDHYPIRPHDLIGLWIGEGMLGDTSEVDSLRNSGQHVLGRLNRVCLLESGHDFQGEFVKMHNVIRDMAAWIANGHEQMKSKWLMIEKQEELSAEMISKWANAEKVSMWGEWIEKINHIPPKCPRLETLILRKTNLKTLPEGFFISMVARLIVLDLSDNSGIKSFPEDICNLNNLQYLNLSATSIQELHKDIGKLTCLRWLLLEFMEMDILIPEEAITNLPLNVLSMWGSESKEEKRTLDELGHMQPLTDLSIRVKYSPSVKEIFRSLNLRNRLRRVEIFRCHDLASIEIHQPPTGNGNFSCLETLSFFKCHKLKTVETQGIRPTPNFSYFPSLVDVEISYCGFSDLSWLVHAPKLRELTVRNCSSLEKIVGDRFEPKELAALRLWSCLKSINLSDLKKLTSICDQALSFQQGVKFQIFSCPGLRRLPLDGNKAGVGSFSVEGDQKWWTQFEWDPAARVIVRLDETGEMTYGAAQGKIVAGFGNSATIAFLPRSAE